MLSSLCRAFSRSVKSSSALMILLVSNQSSFASEADAAELMAAAASASFSFSAQHAADDIALSFMHFTKEGRANLLAELQRTNVITQALAKNGALKVIAAGNRLTAVRKAGRTGADEYDVRGDVELQWSVCDGGPCVPAGPRKKITVTGTVVPVMAYGRPSYKVSSISLTDAAK